MSVHAETTKVIKAGRSKTPFLLFFGNRKQEENEPFQQLSKVLIPALIALVLTFLGICIYSFFKGRLG